MTSARASAARLLRRAANRLDPRRPRISLDLTSDIGVYVGRMVEDAIARLDKRDG